jgi:tetratricopeptide (TPR) repeat protein
VRGISDLERGINRTPRRETVQLLADALQLAPQDRAALEAAARNRQTPPASPAALGLASALPTAGSAGPPSRALPPLVGRTKELALIEALLTGEPPSLLVLLGEPGIGKSRLLAEASAVAPIRGWRVLAGGCTRRNGQEPYAPFVGLLAQAITQSTLATQRHDLAGCSWLVRLLPELADGRAVPVPHWRVPPEQERRLVFGAVARYLANVAGPSGTLLLLDDLQWTGQDALDLLASLVRPRVALDVEGQPRAPDDAQPIAPPLRVIGAGRDTELRPGDPLSMLLADLGRDRLVANRQVSPLSSAEASELAQTLLGEYTRKEAFVLTGDAGTDLAVELAERTGGRPFFLVSCAQALRLAREEGTAWEGSAALQLPWNVAASIRQRVALLPQPAQDVLRVAAVAGRRTARLVLMRIGAQIGLTEPALLAALEAADRARLLLEAGPDSYAFAHDLVREVVLGDLSAARRAVVHRWIGDVLEGLRERQRPPAVLAWHFLQAGEHARALPYALVAGDHAEAVYAHVEAEQHYRTALDLARELGDGAREAEACEKLGRALSLLGRYDETIELSERALRGYQALGDLVGELRALATVVFCQSSFGRSRGLVDEAAARAREILAPIEASIEASIETPIKTQDAPRTIPMLTSPLLSGLAAVYNSLGWLYWTSGRYSEMMPVDQRAVDLARAAGDEAQLAWALLRLFLAQQTLGQKEDRVSLDEMLAVAERSGQTQIVVSAHNLMAEHHGSVGAFALGMPHAEQAVVVAERQQDPIRLAWQLHNFARFLFDVGDWSRARDMFARGAAILREADPHGASWQAAGMMIWPGTLALVEGREEDGRRLLEQAISKIEQVGNRQFLWRAVGPLAEADLLAGHAEQAQLRLAPVALMPDSLTQDSMVHPLLAWAEGALGLEAQAEARLQSLIAGADTLIRQDALRVQGLLATGNGRWAEARRALEEALARARAMPYLYGEAKTLWASGRLEAACGDTAAARTCFKQSLAICKQLGEGLYRPHIEAALAGRSLR